MNNFDIDYSKLRKLSFEFNEESKLFLSEDGKTIYKLLKDNYRDEGKINTLMELYNYQNPNCVLPRFLIENDLGSILGYGMDYLYDYESLYKYLLSNDLSIEEKKKLCKKLSKIFKKLEEDEFVYGDIHSNNIMIKGDSIKLIDMDNGVFYSSLDNENAYRNKLICSRKRLADLFIQIMINTNYTFVNGLLVSYNLVNELKKVSSDKQKKFLDYTYSLRPFMFEPAEYIDCLDEEFANNTSKVLGITE